MPGAIRIFSRLLELLDVSGVGDGQFLKRSGSQIVGADAPTGGTGTGTASDMLSVLTSAEVSVTAAAALTLGKMHVCSGTSANYTVTLPAVTGNAGKFVGVRMAAGLTKLVTVDAGSGVQIDGQQTRVMWSQESAILLCDGTGWSKVAGKSMPFTCLMAPSGATTANNNAEVKVPIATAVIDNGGLMADSTNRRILAPRSNPYNITACVRFSLTANTARCVAFVHKNGASTYYAQSECAGLSNGYPFACVPSLLSLAAGDYVELYGYQNGGTAQSIAGDGTTGNSFLCLEERPSW